VSGPGQPPSGDTSAQEQAAAAQLIIGCNAALRTFKIHATDNKAVERPLDSVINAAETLIAARGKTVLAQVERLFFLGDTRIRLSGAQQGIADQLAAELSQRGLGGLTFEDVPARDELIGLFHILNAHTRALPDTVDSMRKELRSAGIRSLRVNKPLRAISEADQDVDAKDKAAHIYATAFEHAKSVKKAAGSGQEQSAVRSQRIVQELVDLSSGDPRTVLALAGLRGAGDDSAEHAIAVAILSVAIGRRLGLSKQTLADLGVAAIHHDIGLQFLGAAQRTDDLDVHPMLAVKTLVGRTTPDPRVLRQVVVAFEHHLDFQRGGHPPLRFKKRLHPLSQIVRIADDFDWITRGRFGRELDVLETLDQMRDGAGTRYHPGLLKVFVDLVEGAAPDEPEEAELAPAEAALEPPQPAAAAVAGVIHSRRPRRDGPARKPAPKAAAPPRPLAARKAPKAGKPKKVLGALKLKRIKAPGK